MAEQVDFKITVKHGASITGRHEWFFPNGWRGVGPLEYRDKAGRLQGERDGYFPAWFVLMCNDTECPGRAVVPVRVLTDHADRCDPDATAPPTRHDPADAADGGTAS